ncbi:MAG: sulfotransferase [Chloroflexi bacterium]|nr:sulfotransferase [Chloroflexota bacterium]
MSSIQSRSFIVGCARSGTTLLQAMVSSHPRIFSFPESHFFCRAVPRRRRYRLLGLVDRRSAQAVLAELTGLVGKPELVDRIPARSPMFRAYARAFVEIVDAAAIMNRRDMWVEKTPHHVDFVSTITAWVPSARFLHILRDGRDVVASQVDAQREDPAYWGNWSLERLVELWNLDVGKSLAHRGEPDHLFVSYEALIASPERELRRVCEFLDIEFDPSMLEFWTGADRVLGWRAAHPWMQTARKPIQDTRLKKFDRLFTSAQKDYVSAHLLWGGEVSGVLGWPLPSSIAAR